MGVLSALVVGTVGMLTLFALDYTPLALVRTAIPFVDIKPMAIIFTTTAALWLLPF